ncbi:hypothetical protein HAX54_046406 [Datura stramonium]|uniref:Uncharacterized protein n=1 Tax=Datura stramonium TaxID=4076 RepID=A0ABS8SRU7_DATST|nr:hypothetical protein [Datura stramonium]
MLLYYRESFAYVSFVNFTLPWSDDSLFHFVENPICNFELLDLAKGDDMDLLSLVPSFLCSQPQGPAQDCHLPGAVHEKDHVEWGFDKLFQPLEILFEKMQRVLEEFVIISKRRMCDRCSNNCLSPIFISIDLEAVGLQGSFTKFMIIFRE